MVALLSECCCRDYYIPNFRIFYRYVDTHTVQLDGIVHKVLALDFYFSTRYPDLPIRIPYFFGTWFLYLRNGFEYPPGDKVIFPLSPYDSIEYYILKPEFLAKKDLDIALNISDHFDRYTFLYRDKRDFTDVVDLLMERFAPCFSSLYYYYMPIFKPGPIDYYARLLTYDEFLTTIRSRFQEIFDYVKVDHYYNWSAQSGRYFKIHFTIEKEPHINANI